MTGRALIGLVALLASWTIGLCCLFDLAATGATSAQYLAAHWPLFAAMVAGAWLGMRLLLERSAP